MPSEQEQIELAIRAQEGLRSVVGDAVVEATIAVLKAKLANLGPVAGSAGQRKVVTVLEADLAGFTTLGEALDAEDLRDLINELWIRVDGVITQHRGRVDKHLGDAVIAVWGAGAAQEDDPEQAVRAALAIQVAMASLRSTGARVEERSERSGEILAQAAQEARTLSRTPPLLWVACALALRRSHQGDLQRARGLIEQIGRLPGHDWDSRDLTQWVANRIGAGVGPTSEDPGSGQLLDEILTEELGGH